MSSAKKTFNVGQRVALSNEEGTETSPMGTPGHLITSPRMFPPPPHISIPPVHPPPPHAGERHTQYLRDGSFLDFSDELPHGSPSSERKKKKKKEKEKGYPGDVFGSSAQAAHQTAISPSPHLPLPSVATPAAGSDSVWWSVTGLPETGTHGNEHASPTPCAAACSAQASQASHVPPPPGFSSHDSLAVCPLSTGVNPQHQQQQQQVLSVAESVKQNRIPPTTHRGHDGGLGMRGQKKKIKFGEIHERWYEIGSGTADVLFSTVTFPGFQPAPLQPILKAASLSRMLPTDMNREMTVTERQNFNTEEGVKRREELYRKLGLRGNKGTGVLRRSLPAPESYFPPPPEAPPSGETEVPLMLSISSDEEEGESLRERQQRKVFNTRQHIVKSDPQRVQAPNRVSPRDTQNISGGRRGRTLTAAGLPSPSRSLHHPHPYAHSSSMSLQSHNLCPAWGPLGSELAASSSSSTANRARNRVDRLLVFDQASPQLSKLVGLGGSKHEKETEKEKDRDVVIQTELVAQKVKEEEGEGAVKVKEEEGEGMTSEERGKPFSFSALA